MVVTTRRRRRPVALAGLIALPPPQVAHDNLEAAAAEGREDENMYALNRNYAIPDEPPEDADSAVDRWRQQVTNYLTTLVAQNKAMDARIAKLEKERDLLQARFGGIVWAFGFIFSGIALGLVSFWNELRSLWTP